MIDRVPRNVLANYLAETLGVFPDTFGYHVRKGYVLPPSHPLVNGSVDKGLYYTLAEAENIVRFFQTRQMYDRRKKTPALTH